jgi:hypothetical protein
LVVDRGERQRIHALEEIADVFQARGGPFDCLEQLRHADAAVAIVVDQRESFFVELQSFDRAAQGDPKLLVEVFEIQKVGPGFERHLIKSAGTGEIPAVGGGSGE